MNRTMSRGERERAGDSTGACVKSAAARVILFNRSRLPLHRVYPALMMDGVYRMSFAMGLAVYALPACAALPSNGITRHRARVKARDAQRAFRTTFIDHNTNISRADFSRAQTNREPAP